MKNFDRIERYLSNSMPEAERNAFEQEMTEDDSLRQEVEVQRLEEELLSFSIEEGIRGELRAVITKGPPAARRFRLQRYFPVIGAAASLLLIIGVFYFMYRGSQPVPATVAVTEYKSHMPLFTESKRGGKTEAPTPGDPLAEALGWLEDGSPGRLSDARERLSLVAEGDPSYRRARYYLGHACFLQGKYGEAAAQFRRILPSFREGSRLKQETQYYLLLSLMASGAGQREYQPLLEQILADPDHPFYPRARAVSAELQD